MNLNLHINLPLFFFGIAYAAFFVWLVVRIVSRRERWAIWTLAMVLGQPVLYLLSFGPACWFASPSPEASLDHMPQVSLFYWPVGWVFVRGNGTVQGSIRWYATRRSKIVLVPTEHDGTSVTVSALR